MDASIPVVVATIGAVAVILNSLLTGIVGPLVVERYRQRQSASATSSTSTASRSLLRSPRAWMVAGSVITAFLVFWLIWSLATQSAPRTDTLADHPDSEEQRHARTLLYEFLVLAANDTYRDTVNFSNDVHTRLGVGKGFDPKQSVAGLLRNYAEADFAAKFTALSNVRPPNGKEVPFTELSRLFEQVLCSYEKLVFWTQRAALLIPITLDSDAAYQQWNKTDIEFHRRLKETTAKRGLYHLGVCGPSFRLRDGVK